MAVVERILFLFFLITVWPLTRGDAVVCTLNKSCILPCRFEKGDKVLIHWLIHTETIVHSYYNDADQLDSQLQTFKGRTSLFYDQISEGNASLKLTPVTLQDSRKYTCYTSTVVRKQESPVDLTVEAPPSKVDIRREGNKITCSSDKIYPKPELTWSSDPPNSLTGDPTITEAEQLFSISSSLTVPDGETDVDYTCTISAGTSKRKATLLRTVFPAPITTSEATTIHCPSLSTASKSISWRFNNREIILTKTATDASSKVTERWKKHVKNPSSSETLTLEELSEDQGGIYTCEVSSQEETLVKSTVLQIEIGGNSVGPAIGIAVAVLVVLVMIIVVFIRYRSYFFAMCTQPSDGNEGQQTGTETPEGTPLRQQTGTETTEETPLRENGGQSAENSNQQSSVPSISGPPMREYYNELHPKEDCTEDTDQS